MLKLRSPLIPKWQIKVDITIKIMLQTGKLKLKTYCERSEFAPASIADPIAIKIKNENPSKIEKILLLSNSTL